MSAIATIQLLVTAVLVVAASVGLALALWFAVQVFLAGRPSTARPRDLPGAVTAGARVAVLVPAHDEALGIAEPLALMRAQLRPCDRLLVVADNCSDDTAAVARAAGAEVVERQDAARRGKGYALDFGVRHLAADPPDVVIIVDADCRIDAGALPALAAACQALERPVQALYLMQSDSGAGLGTRIAEFAWIVKNHVRPLGLRRLGSPCQLTGSGMAFPWDRLRDVPLADGNLVEDMKLGLALAANGGAPAFAPWAVVRSTFPTSADGLRTQRTRWEHGHLRMIVASLPRMLRQAWQQRQPALAAMAFDLAIPPLASLVLALFVLTLISAGLAWTGASAWPLAMSLVSLAAIVGATLLAWWRFGRAVVSFIDLLGVPLYVARKIPVYLRLLGARQTEWVRTRRDDAGA